MCDRFDIGRNVYMGRLTCLLLMNKDLFSLLGWNNIFGVNTNSDHVPRRGINGRDIYFHKNVRLWPILCDDSLCLSRSLSSRISCVGSRTLMDRRVVRFFCWLSESFLSIPALAEAANIGAHKTFPLSASHPPLPPPSRDLSLCWQFLYLLPKLNLANLILHLLSALNLPSFRLSRNRFEPIQPEAWTRKNVCLWNLWRTRQDK